MKTKQKQIVEQLQMHGEGRKTSKNTSFFFFFFFIIFSEDENTKKDVK